MQSCCSRERNWLYSVKVVVIGQSGCIREKVVVFGQSCCNRKKLLYSRKVVIFGEWVAIGQSSCIRGKAFFLKKVFVFGQKWL